MHAILGRRIAARAWTLPVRNFLVGATVSGLAVWAPGVDRSGDGTGPAAEPGPATVVACPSDSFPLKADAARHSRARRLVDGGEYQVALDLLEPAVSEVRARYGPDSYCLARTLDLIVEAHLRLRTEADSVLLQLATEATQIKRESSEEISRVGLARGLMNLGHLLLRAGRPEDAFLSIEEAAATAEAFYRRHAGVYPDFALAELYLRLTKILVQEGYLERAEGYVERARTELDSASSPPLSMRVRISLYRAQIRRSQWRYEEAAAELESLTEGPAGRSLTASRWWGRWASYYAVLSADLGRYGRALELHAQAIERLRAGPGPRSLLADALRRQAATFHLVGDLAASRRAFDEARQIDETIFEPGSPRRLESRLHQATLALHTGDIDGSLRATLEALGSLWPHPEGIAPDVRDCLVQMTEVGPRVTFTRPGLVSRLLDNLGLVMERRGDTDCAARLYERVLEIRSVAFGDDHPETSLSWVALGRLRRSLGDDAGATEALRQVLDMRRPLPPTSPHRIRAELELADHEAETGNPMQAFDRLTSVIDRLRPTTDGAAAATAPFGTSVTASEVTSPLLSRALRDRARLSLLLGRPQEAFEDASYALELASERLRAAVPALSPSDLFQFERRELSALDLMVAAWLDGPGAHGGDASSVVDAIVRSHGVVLQRELDRHEGRIHRTEPTGSVSAALSERLTHLHALKFAGMVGEHYWATLARAEALYSERERVSRESLPSGAPADLNGVRAALPKASALVGYLIYADPTCDPASPPQRRYATYGVRPDAPRGFETSEP